MDPNPSLPIESSLVRRLLADEFALTAEVTPPVSAGREDLLTRAEPLRGCVDAVNVTDGASARVHMSGLTAAAILVAEGIEPVVQFTCRDRNRIALLSDLLGAAAMGINNALFLTGDDPSAGDQPDAKPVFDLQSAELIRIAADMTKLGIVPSKSVKKTSEGIASNSRAIETPPKFFIGAADVPTDTPNEKWLGGLKRKEREGAQFIQTQLCYDMDVVRAYAGLLREEGLTEHLFFLIGIGPLKSARSAIWMRENLWGVVVPDEVVKRLEDAKDPIAEGIRICVEQLQELAEIKGISGAHLMAPANIDSIPEAIAGADIAGRRA